jgi:Fe2+ transport system protein FeoA
MLLSEAKEKDSIVILGFGDDKPIRKRLMDMGLKIGSEFRIILVRQRGSIVLYNDDLKIVLDKTVASNIMIEVL